MERKKIINLRKKFGRSQSDVANAMHKSIHTYRRIEAGRIQLSDQELLFFHSYFNCKIDEIVEDPEYLIFADHRAREPLDNVRLNILAKHMAITEIQRVYHVSVSEADSILEMILLQLKCNTKPAKFPA